jgi:hypothetical protein
VLGFGEAGHRRASVWAAATVPRRALDRLQGAGDLRERVGERPRHALALALALAAEGLPAPAPALVYAISPFSDLSVSGASVDAARGRDPVGDRSPLVGMAASYLHGHDPRDPLASPIHGRSPDVRRS